MKNIKVRFNLGAGQNYMKWKVEYPDGIVQYHDPKEVQLVMYDCTLKNYKKTSQKIYEGGEKVVCAWVLCNQVDIKTNDFELGNENKIKFNPRIQPNWILNGEIVDGKKFEEIISVDYGLFMKQNKNTSVLN